MIAIYSENALLGAKIANAAREPVSHFATVEKLYKAAAQTHAVILGLADSNDHAAGLIREVQRRTAYVGIVVVMPLTRECARMLKDFTIDEIIWADEIEDRLTVALARAATKSTAYRFGRMMANHPHLRGRIGKALLNACSANPPLRSPAEVAGLAHCSLRSLESAFRRGFESLSDGTVQRTLAWARVLWAADRLRSGMTRSKTARLLKVDLRTLERLMQRLPGMTICEVKATHPNDLLYRALQEFDYANSGDLAADESRADV